MFAVEIKWFDEWCRVATGYETRDDAEWDVGHWKSKYGLSDDSVFRVVEQVD